MLDLEFLVGAQEALKEGSFAKSLIESIAPDGLLVIDNKERIIMCNPSIEVMLDYKRKQLLKKNISVLFEDKKELTKCIKELEDGGKYCLCDAVFVTKKGERRNVGLSLSLIAGTENKVFIVRDRTEKMKTEKKFQEMFTNYKTLVENCNEGIAVIQDKKIIFVNKTVLDDFGYDQKELIGKDFDIAVAPEEREKLKSNYKKRIKGEKIKNIYTTKLLSKDGRKMFVELNSNLITYNGKPAVLVLIRTLHVFEQGE